MARAVAFPELPTPRLNLRRIERGNAEALHACLGDADCMRYWNMPATTSVTETADLIVKWLGKTTSPYDHMAWAVTEVESDRCIGMVNYHHREAGNRRLEIGYVIAPRHQGKGFGREAVAALIDHCSGPLGVHRIDALIEPDNLASIALAESLGFRCEGGPLSDYWRVGERWLSPMIYARIGGAPSYEMGYLTESSSSATPRTRRRTP